jgi:hypothetical protein
MNFAFLGTFALLILSTSLNPSSAHARGYLASTSMNEENSMVANGQGISSPSFWDGISGANPAGLINNVDLKLQGAAASFDDTTNNLRGSGGAFAGNGMIAGGLEYSTFNQGPLPSGKSQINGGLAANLSALQTAVGISTHRLSDNGGNSYDVGALITLAPQLRVGAMIPDFSNGLQLVAGGFTYAADPSVDFVVDAGYQLRDKNGIVKPGLSIHTNLIQATASYGFRFEGDSDDVLVTTKFSAALGLKLAEKILIEYEYRGLPEHRLGLTLRFN